MVFLLPSPSHHLSYRAQYSLAFCETLQRKLSLGSCEAQVGTVGMEATDLIMTNTTFDIVVTGESMWPVLVPGQRYLARRDLDPKLGDIVVARHPYNSSTTIVKRVVKIQANSKQRSANRRSEPFTIHDSRFTLSGTVSWSSTSTVTRPQILGVIEL